MRRTKIKEEMLYGISLPVEKEVPEPKITLKIEIFTAGKLTKYIKDLLESDKKLTNLWVRGEISNLTQHSSGHIYFSLKDEKSQIRCVLFRRVGKNLEFNLNRLYSDYSALSHSSSVEKLNLLGSIETEDGHFTFVYPVFDKNSYVSFYHLFLLFLPLILSNKPDRRA